MPKFNDERLAWRDIPTRSVFGRDGSGYHLEQAGYYTLGDILSATEEDLISRVARVGPVRASRIRQRALAVAQVATHNTAPAAEARPDGRRRANPVVALGFLLAAFTLSGIFALAITQGG